MGFLEERAKRRAASGKRLTPEEVALLSQKPIDEVYPDPSPKPEALVYFIGSGDTGPVKIGVAAVPSERMASLQVAHFAPLALLATTTGGRAAERGYHQRFADARLHGCGSAWKRDPGSGVIGVEKGPLIPVV